MKDSLSLLLRGGFVCLLLIIVGNTAPALSLRQGQLTIFLPIVSKNAAPTLPPSSFDKIDDALESGQIGAETAMKYKTFAVFGDARLPAAFQSSVVGGEASLYMLEVVETFPGLSAATQEVLKPFFIPPFKAGSWWSLGQSQVLAAAAPSDWEYITAVSGKARVWYLKTNLENKRQAGVIAAALNSPIWTRETDLMGREPVPDEAGVQNFVVFHRYRETWDGAFVSYDGAGGVTVPLNCSQTPSIIYINPALPDTGGTAKVGLIEVTAHEFMHALQYAFPMKDNKCSEYDWIAEASATWAEDLVYKSTNSEWRYAQGYLDNTGKIINDRSDLHDYGAYLLPFFYSREYDNEIGMRYVWQNAGSMDSLQAAQALINFNYEQVEMLWNQEPFNTWLLAEEGMTYHAKAEVDGTLTPGGGFNEVPLKDDLQVGAIRFFHYTVAEAARTIIFMDGLTTKISRVSQGDNKVFQQDPVSYDDSKGAQVLLLVKYQGQDEPWRLFNPGSYGFCQDWSQQKISEFLVIQNNQDMTDRNRTLTSTGEDSRFVVTSVPCIQVKGTAKRTIEANGVTTKMESSDLTFEYAGFDPGWPWQADIIGNQNIHMAVKSGTVSWNISGTDQNGCTYSGSDSFTLHPENNGSSLTLYHGYLPGSQQHIGYYGSASPDSGEYATYTVKCPDEDPVDFDEYGLIFFIPDGMTPVTASGALQGQIVIDNGGGITETFEWNLQPVRQ